MRTSCIKHGQNERYLKVRQLYVDLCDGNGCAGALLSVFESWTNTRLKHLDQAEAINRRARKDGRPETQDTGLWVWRTKSELIEDLCGLYGRGALDTAIELLLKKGLIERRQNPSDPRDRTLEYLLKVEVVNGLLEQKRKSASGKADSSDCNGEDPPLLDAEEDSVNDEKPPLGAKSDVPPEKIEQATKFCRWLSNQADEEPRDSYPASQLEAAIELLDSKPKEELRAVVQWAHTRPSYWPSRVRTAGRLRQNWDDARAEWRGATKNAGSNGAGGRPDRDAERRERTKRRLGGQSV